ncbi:uncharacterized protein G2W53_004351 [Senna tora]|uniref:Uncharacterized protein n=1 Tax=Senna tora TaxID=362788 RepID=A0A834XF19_9FABA|nr:uncharacterized protein G2W53_004351 [Senna tora]
MSIKSTRIPKYNAKRSDTSRTRKPGARSQILRELKKRIAKLEEGDREAILEIFEGSLKKLTMS